MDTISFPSADEQQRILNEASLAIKRSAFQMRKAIEEDNMREALKHASAMLGELRTSQLQPQKYYELYMLAFDQLAYLESFFADERGKGRSYAELYELVQHAGNVLPRLYLMVAVGCLYIKSREAPPQDVLKDLVEMCKGVQHPTRGLFLRAYLCQRAKGLLPDTGSEYEAGAAAAGADGVAAAAGGTIHDALDFLMTNFIEMNKLWVRLQHQGSARDKDKRERERQQLQDLVGKNLTYLSQLDGLSFELYRDLVLPRVLDQITSCRDDLAQLYLMQALIQGFPDRFHLGTLETLLGVLPQLQPGVKVHSVMAALMDRLARYAGAPAAGPSAGGAAAGGSGAGGRGGAPDPRVVEQLAAIGAFDKFKQAISQIISSQPSLAAADAVEMYTALMGYVGAVHGGDLAAVNEVLAAAQAALGAMGRGPGLGGDARAERQLVALLTIPIARFGVDVALGLDQYPSLARLLRYTTHKELAVKIVQRVLEQQQQQPGGADQAGTSSSGEAAGGAAASAAAAGPGVSVISSVDKVRMLFRFIAPLVADPELPGEAGGAADLDDEDLDEEQVLVARLLHHLRSDDPDTHFAILGAVRQQLLEGGPLRMRTTLPALVFCGLALHRRVAERAGGGSSSSSGGSKGPVDGGKQEEEEGEKEEQEGKEDGEGEEQEAKGKGKEGSGKAEAKEAAAPPKVTCEALLQFLLAAIDPLTGGPAAQPLTALRLLLACAHAASEEAGLEVLGSTLLEEALVLYDQALPDQRQRATALYELVGVLQRCRAFSPDTREALTSAATTACLRLLTRREQCRALCAAAYLWWQQQQPADAAATPGAYPPVRDGAKVVYMLDWAAKVARQAKGQYGATGRVRDATYVSAYADVLDAALRFWDAGVPGVDQAKVQELIDAVAADLAAGVVPDAGSARRWATTLSYIQQQAAGPGKERYGKLKVPPAVAAPAAAPEVS